MKQGEQGNPCEETAWSQQVWKAVSKTIFTLDKWKVEYLRANPNSQEGAGRKMKLISFSCQSKPSGAQPAVGPKQGTRRCDTATKTARENGVTETARTVIRATGVGKVPPWPSTEPRPTAPMGMGCRTVKALEAMTAVDPRVWRPGSICCLWGHEAWPMWAEEERHLRSGSWSKRPLGFC